MFICILSVEDYIIVKVYDRNDKYSLEVSLAISIVACRIPYKATTLISCCEFLKIKPVLRYMHIHIYLYTSHAFSTPRCNCWKISITIRVNQDLTKLALYQCKREVAAQEWSQRYCSFWSFNNRSSKRNNCVFNHCSTTKRANGS